MSSPQSAMPTLAWFEEVCSQLSRNPMAATALLEDFREQECALEAVNSYLRAPECSPMAQFQACFVMQYNSLKNWSRLSVPQIAQLKETLFAVLQNAIATATMPPFALNKVTQCYVLFWKRGWKELSSEEKQTLFHQITFYVQQATNPVAFRHGAILLRVLVEEFAMRSPAEANLPSEFHRQAHTAFEEYGLDHSLQLGMQCLSTAISMANADQAVPCITEAVKLFSEVLSWDFGTNAIANAFQTRKPTASMEYARSTGPSHLLTVPRRWSPLLLQTSFIDSICDVYMRTRNLLGHIIASSSSSSSLSSNNNGTTSSRSHQGPIDEMLACLMELRMLLVSMSSIAGQIFENDAERLALGTCVMRHVVPMLDSAVDTKWDTAIVGDFRAQECENLGTVLLRLLGNFRLSLCCQMSCFDQMMMSLGRTTFELSKELALLAEAQLGRIYNPNASTSTSSKSDDSLWLAGEPGLLEGWRGDAVMLFLDVWCMVLDDPLMLHSAFVDSGVAFSNGTTNAQVSTALKLGLRGMAAEVFKQLFESILRITICEALAVPEEEEEGEEEAIQVRNMDDMLGAICTVGRTNFAVSLDYMRQAIAMYLLEAEKTISTPGTPGGGQTAAASRDILRILESLRIAVLFTAHLCDDTFRANADDSSSETRLIPSFVLDSCLHAPETTQILRDSVLQMTRILQLQLHVASSSPSHPMFSPLVLQILMRFFSEYFERFVGPDAGLYSANTATSIPHLFKMHTEGAARPELDAIVELLAAVIHQLIVQVPLESDLVQAMADLLIAISKSASPERMVSLLSSPSVGKIFHTVVGECRLNFEGMAAIYRALGSLAARANSESTMMQLCTFVHTKVQALPALSTRGQELMFSTQQCVACLRGLASCPKGQDKVLHSLFDACLPVITSSLQVLSRADDVTKAILLMFRDYAEYKLSGLPAHSSAILYNTSMAALQNFATRLQPTYTGSAASAEDEESYRSECLLHMLELLNHLATKDFVFDDEDDVAASGGDFHMTVAEVLLFGFDFIVQLVTPDLLRLYPTTAERYFSFTAFITSTYSDELGARLSALPEAQGKTLLGTMMSHMLWGAGGIAPTPARQALQSIYSMAAFQAAAMSKSDVGVGMTVAVDVFPRALDRLLEMILFPNTCEYGIAWDRVDSCANALIGLIVLDNQRFMQSAQAAMQQFTAHSPSTQEALLACFRRLTSNNGVSLNNNNKANRQLFVTNFREFVLEIRPLIM